MRAGDKFIYGKEIYSFVEWWDPQKSPSYNYAYVNAINANGKIETLRIPCDPIRFPNHNVKLLPKGSITNRSTPDP